MDKEPTTTTPSQRIEISEDLPVALLVVNERCIGPLLAQKLLELPLEVIYLTENEADEVKHLIPNQRFILKKTEAVSQTLGQDVPNPSYIFSIETEEKQSVGVTQGSPVAEALLRLAREKEAKFERVLIMNPGNSTNSVNGEETIQTVFANSDKRFGVANSRIVKMVDLY